MLWNIQNYWTKLKKAILVKLFLPWEKVLLKYPLYIIKKQHWMDQNYIHIAKRELLLHHVFMDFTHWFYSKIKNRVAQKIPNLKRVVIQKRTKPKMQKIGLLIFILWIKNDNIKTQSKIFSANEYFTLPFP